MARKKKVVASAETEQQQKKKGKRPRSSNKKQARKLYYQAQYFLNKLKRILKSQGLPAARDWAEKNKATNFLKAFVR